MIHRSLRLTKGVFDLVGRGDGIICPKCRNFAPSIGGKQFRCQRCGAVLKTEEIGALAAPVQQGKPQRAKTTVPSGNLGRRAQQVAPPAPETPAPEAPEEPKVTTTPKPHDTLPPALDEES